MGRILGGRHALLAAVLVLVSALAIVSVLILAEDDPPAVAEEELPAGCQPGLPYLTCTYTSSTKLPFNSMLSQIEGATNRKASASTPVWVQAWGGRGAKGASYEGYAGAFGGYAGYAITVSSAGALAGDTLYLYVGASGSKHANYSGQGGAATLVATQPISANASVPGNLLVVAGGSGGGGKNCQGEFAGRGGNGGVAVAGHVKHDATAGTDPFLGVSGEPGGGGTGGAAGEPGALPGTNGLGGYGGAGNSDGSSTGWVNVAAVDPAASGWNSGAGGLGRGGGGGGGYGGGGGGGGCQGPGEKENGGGGGGGSWTLEPNTVNDPDAPIDSKQGDGAQSKVILTFHLS